MVHPLQFDGVDGKHFCRECGEHFKPPDASKALQDISLSILWGICPPCRERINDWWKMQKDSGRHICDYSIEQLKERHKNVLALIPKYSVRVIGTMLMGHYYLDGFGSRSCAGKMAELVSGDEEYLMFYCGSSEYLELCMEGRPMHLVNEELINDFNKACQDDDERCQKE